MIKLETKGSSKVQLAALDVKWSNRVAAFTVPCPYPVDGTSPSLGLSYLRAIQGPLILPGLDRPRTSANRRPQLLPGLHRPEAFAIPGLCPIFRPRLSQDIRRLHLLFFTLF